MAETRELWAVRLRQTSKYVHATSFVATGAPSDLVGGNKTCERIQLESGWVRIQGVSGPGGIVRTIWIPSENVSHVIEAEAAGKSRRRVSVPEPEDIAPQLSNLGVEA